MSVSNRGGAGEPLDEPALPSKGLAGSARSWLVPAESREGNPGRRDDDPGPCGAREDRSAGYPTRVICG